MLLTDWLGLFAERLRGCHRARRRPRRRRRLAAPSTRLEVLERREMLSGATAPPEIQNLRLLNDTSTPADFITSDATITGDLVDDGGSSEYWVEIDVDGDNVSDTWFQANPGEAFTYDLSQHFGYGSITVNVVASEWDDSISDYLYGSWVPISFTYEDPMVNDAPVGNADGYDVLTNETTTIGAGTGVLANDTDGDGDPLTAVLVTGPANGSLTLNADGSFTYTPNAGYLGPDSFTYKSNDGVLDSSDTTVTLQVYGGPVWSSDDSYSVNHDTPLSVGAHV